MQSERKQKAESFRKSIRREELDNYFQERRNQILQIIQEEQVREITNQLQTSIQRQQFLTDAAHDLCGEPKAEWLPIIKHLRKVLSIFSGQFHLWVSKSIVGNMCLAYKQQYKQIGLADQITSLLIDMVYLSFETYPKFVVDLMEYQIVADVLALASDKYKSLEGKIHYLMLLGKIASRNAKYRDSILRDGAGFILVEIGKELMSLGQVNEKTILKYLEVAYHFCYFHKTNSFNQLINLANPLSQIILYFLCAQQVSWKVLSLCILTINFLLKMQKPVIYRNIYFNDKFVLKGLSLYQHPQASVRAKIAITFCFITNLGEYCKDLMEKGILDYIYTAYEKLQTKKNFCFTKSALYTLSNMGESEYQAEQIICHPAFEIITQEIASQSGNLQAAFFALNSILIQLKYMRIQDILKKYDVLKYLVQVLLQSVYSHEVYTQVLEILLMIIKKSLEIYYLENPIIGKLEAVYNISIVVENIRKNIKNKLIAAKADQLIQLIQSNLLDNYHNSANSI